MASADDTSVSGITESPVPAYKLAPIPSIQTAVFRRTDLLPPSSCIAGRHTTARRKSNCDGTVVHDRRL